MSDFSIRPDLISIIKSKKKFLYIGVILLVINFCCIIRYMDLALNRNLLGYYLFIFVLVNLPLFVVAIILLFVPKLHKSYYSKLIYKFNNQVLSVGNSDIKIDDIEMLEVVEFYPGYYKIYIFLKSESKNFELSGIHLNDLDRIRNWANLYDLSIYKKRKHIDAFFFG